MAPTVSIIIPIFNAEAYLARCLDSILAQSYSDWECILVEDGSTDGSGRICDCYAAKDARFKAIHGSNKGVSTARNKGIQLSGGQWFYFCDADDEVMPNALETLIHECDSSGSDLVFGGYVECDEHGLVIAEPSNEWHRQLSVDETLCELYKATNCTYEGYLWCKLFRAELIRDHHIRFAEDIYFNEDRLFIVEYLCHVSTAIAYTSTPVYRYYHHDNSAYFGTKSKWNPRYITDLLAYVRMYHIVLSLTDSLRPRQLAKKGIRRSIRTILRRLHDTRTQEPSVIHELKDIEKRYFSICERLYLYYLHLVY